MITANAAQENYREYVRVFDVKSNIIRFQNLLTVVNSYSLDLYMVEKHKLLTLKLTTIFFYLQNSSYFKANKDHLTFFLVQTNTYIYTKRPTN